MAEADLHDFPRVRVTPDEARCTRVQPGHLSALAMAHGSMELRWFVPDREDKQTPHDRDELYFIVTGTAVFVRDEQRTPFGAEPPIGQPGEEQVTVQPGDALFVRAGTGHRFEAASPDFGCWMVFYGPEGGETDKHSP